MSNQEHIDKHLYNPRFQWAFLHPKHWGTWLGMLFAIILAFVPVAPRDRFARFISTLIVKNNGRVVRRARVNLKQCFPQKSEQEIEHIVFETFAKAGQFLLGYSELLLRSSKHNQKRGVIYGKENLTKPLANDDKVIILSPHTWTVDYPAIMLAAEGHKLTNIMKPQSNPIGDWLMHVQRMQYGGRIFARSAGIKPFIRSIKDGYIGYWLPDEDHGEKNSVFVPFFDAEKATLKGLVRWPAYLAPKSCLFCPRITIKLIAMKCIFCLH